MTITRSLCFPDLDTSFAKTDVLSTTNIGTLSEVEDPSPSTNPNVIQHKFVLRTGNANEAAYVTLRREYQPKTDFTRNSLRVEALTKITSSLDDSVKYDRLEAQVGWNYSGEHLADTAEILQLIYAAFGLVVDLDEAAGPNGDMVNAFEFGIMSSVAV
jgi:hypothetical protein